MTTGLALDTDPVALTGYVERLVAAGTACLAVGTGTALTHAEVPTARVRAAQRYNLPLLEVPEQTPPKGPPSTSAHARDASRRALTATATTTATAISVNTRVEPVPTLKAAPELRVSCRSRTPETSSTGARAARDRTTTALLMASAASTAPASAVRSSSGRRARVERLAGTPRL